MSVETLEFGGGVTSPQPPSLRRLLWRWMKRLAMVAAVVVALPLVLVPLYAFVPPVSTLMVYDLVTLKGYKRQWVDLQEISERARHSVLVSEDSFHCEHNGVDWKEFTRALDEFRTGEGRGRGASTITMQTAKNLFLWHGRSPIRKAIEVPLALYLDLVLSKKRILEIYLNIVELDTHVYGIEAAAQHYFGHSAAKLGPQRSALLAVTLPNPRARNPAKPTNGLRRLARTIVARAKVAGPYVQCLQ